MYRDGKGVERDLDKAIALMRQAANKNIGWAKNELIDLLLKRNQEEDLNEAFELASDFSTKGDPSATGRLARMYRDGKGVEKDLNKAIELMRQAADSNILWAKNELDAMMKKMKNAN